LQKKPLKLIGNIGIYSEFIILNLFLYIEDDPNERDDRNVYVI